MEDYTITMRIYTKFGKEHVYHIDYYRVEGEILIVYSNSEEDIFDVIKCGEPCCVSLLVNTNLEYSECRLDRCSITSNAITFSSQSNKTARL